MTPGHAVAPMPRVRQRLRVTTRLVRAGAATAVLFGSWAIGHVLLAFAPRTRLRWRRTVMRRWCAAVCAAFAVRVEVVGAPPPAGVLLVCNHLSYLDVPVLGSALDTSFVSKAEVAGWPVIGLLARCFDTVFLVRERKRDLPATNAQIARALSKGIGVVVFPEGTSTKGESVLPFRPSLLAPAAEAGLEVWAATLSYRTGAQDPPASTHVCWWGDMPFGPHALEMAALERIEARVEFLREPVRDEDRKRLAEKLQQAIAARFVPVP